MAPQETSAIAFPQTVKFKKKEKKKKKSVFKQTNTNANTQKWKRHKVLLAEDRPVSHIWISVTGMSQPDGQCNSAVAGFPWWKHWPQVANRTMWRTEYGPPPLSPDLPHKHTRSSGASHPTVCQPNRTLFPDLPHKHTRSSGASHPRVCQPNRTSQLTFCAKCLESGCHVFIAN